MKIIHALSTYRKEKQKQIMYGYKKKVSVTKMEILKLKTKYNLRKQD